MTELTRRKVLLSTAALGAAGLAGCVGDSTDDDAENAGSGNGEGDDDPADNGDSENGNSETADSENGDDGTETDDGTGGDDSDSESDGDAGAEEGTDESITLETVNTDCAQGEADTVSVDWGEEAITVQGASPAPNPCHEAVLEEGTVEGESFTLVVDVADANEGGVCQECLGKVEYEATIDVEDPSEVSEGTVRHVQGSSHGIAVASDSAEAPDPSIRDASIETIDASCSDGTERERLVAASRTADGVAVDGVLQAPDPCHRAVLNGRSMTDGHLTVEVAPASTLGEGEVCKQCLGEVQYAVQVDLSNPDALSAVTVSHAGGDQFTFDADDLDSE